MNLDGTASGKGNAEAAAPFNELVDPQGRLRPAYRRFQERTGFHPFSLHSTHVQSLLRSPFADRMQICPIPLILDENDAQTIRSGTRQRAKALQLFFHDMVVGSQSILRSGTVAPEDILTVFNDEGMGLTELRRIWQGKPVSAVRFLYGPDLNRTPSGNWVVTEDNVGRIGGTPEALGAIRSFAQATGASPSDHRNYRDDIEVMVQLFIESLGLKISDPGVVALVPYDPHQYRLRTSRKIRRMARKNSDRHPLGPAVEQLLR